MSEPKKLLPSQDESVVGNVYWHEGLAPLTQTHSIPCGSIDVAVIGSGYTGLHAAIVTARAGHSTQVIDRHMPGWGCSTRNGGQISSAIKPTLAYLTRKYGSEQAMAIRIEGYTSLDWIDSFIKTEGIDCSYKKCGKFHAAHTLKHFDALVRNTQRLGQEEGVKFDVVQRSEQHKELGTDSYFGGVILNNHASLDPAKYYSGLLDKAKLAGVNITGKCPAEHIQKDGDGYIISTPKGEIRARKIIIATNGYTTKLVPWIQRRVVPVGTYMIATEPLPKTLIDKLFPRDRVVSDTCKVIYYYRPSPDRTRVLFGGRVSADETNPAISGPKLKRDMCRIFPELANYDYSHSWTGTVAFTFDKLPHLGCHDGIFYAMGYCGSGIGLSSYLGNCIGQQLLGDSAGATAFDKLRFHSRPLYYGKPWFLPSIVRWYRWRDKMEIKHATARSKAT